MNRRTLSKALRRRQLRKGLVAKSLVQAATDEEIFSAYCVCHRCNSEIFNSLETAIETAGTVDEFLNLVNMALAAHKCNKTPRWN